MHGRRLTLLAALAAALTLPSAALAADGDPDPTFSGDGQAFAQLDDSIDFVANALVDQAPDGSLVVAVAANRFESRARGGSGESIRIYRVSADGEQIDEIGSAAAADPRLYALRVLDDGRIGFVYYDEDQDGAVLGRVDAEGGFDPTLPTEDTELERTCDVSPDEDSAVVRADGGAYLLDECGVWAYDPDGDLDQDWNADDVPGIADLEPEDYEGELATTDKSDIFIAPDGKVVVLVDYDPGAQRGFGVTSALVRYETDGDHDPTFDGDGVALTGNYAYDLTVGPDGRPVVVAEVPLSGRGTKDEWVLQRFTDGGEPDETFGEGSFAGVEGELCCIRNTRITVQPDHKVLMVANHEDYDRGDGPYNRMVLHRFLEDGALDTSFANQGEQVFQAGFDQGPFDWGPPLLQDDGKIVAPISWRTDLDRRAFTVAGPSGPSVAITRFTNPSLEPAVVVEEEKKPAVTPAAVTPAAAPVAGAAPARGAAPRRCLSRRSLTLRLRTGRRKSQQSRIVSVSVTVNGKKVRSTRRGASVNLRNLPKGRYTVVISLRLRDGGRVRDVRRYRTCASKIERELAPLRTRPPR